MIKTGLTGNIGVGKSTVARIFNTIGVPVFNSDTEAKKLYEKQDIIAEVIKIFGKEVLFTDSKINLNKLAKLAFSNNNKLEALNKLIHYNVFNRFDEWIGENNDAAIVIMESALIFESPIRYKFDFIIVVDAEREECFQRVKKRDNLTNKEFEMRLSYQIDNELKKSKADYIINNFGNYSLIDQVIMVYNEMLKQ